MKYDNLIYQLRMKKNLTLKDLGDKIGYSQVGVLHIEKGERQPKASTIIQLSNILDCSIAELVNHFAKNEK